MSEMEYKYYEDWKTERKMMRSKGVDPMWYHSMMKAQRKREREEDYRRERDQQFSYKSLDAISQILIEAGVIVSSSSDEKETFDEVPTTAITEDNAEPPQQLILPSIAPSPCPPALLQTNWQQNF